MSPETIDKCKKIYEEKQNTICWMRSFGNEFEKMEAQLIIDIATGVLN